MQQQQGAHMEKLQEEEEEEEVKVGKMTLHQIENADCIFTVDDSNKEKPEHDSRRPKIRCVGTKNSAKRILALASEPMNNSQATHSAIG